MVKYHCWDFGKTHAEGVTLGSITPEDAAMKYVRHHHKGQYAGGVWVADMTGPNPSKPTYLVKVDVEFRPVLSARQLGPEEMRELDHGKSL